MVFFSLHEISVSASSAGSAVPVSGKQSSAGGRSCMMLWVRYLLTNLLPRWPPVRFSLDGAGGASAVAAQFSPRLPGPSLSLPAWFFETERTGPGLASVRRCRLRHRPPVPPAAQFRLPCGPISGAVWGSPSFLPLLSRYPTPSLARGG